MSLSVGIVGLPNVGKSTLFNALLKKQTALAANYPFATVEPNTGIAQVPDLRLAQLAKVVEQNTGVNPPLKPATIEFVDIAGLVRGASQGEGLGNKFLANIRETDLICHVLRAFEDFDVVITGKMKPEDDLDTVRTELILKDLETVEKNQKMRVKDLKIKQMREQVLAKLTTILSAGKMANTLEFTEEEMQLIVQPLSLLTLKPEIFVVNISEDQLDKVEKIADKFITNANINKKDVVFISAKIESELAELIDSERVEYMRELGIQTSGIAQMAKLAYQKLNLISFLTAGEIECRAWTIATGTKAREAAGVIHTDFSQKFIKARVLSVVEFVKFQGWKKAVEAGKVQQEGKDYIMQDGDVVEFMIGK